MMSDAPLLEVQDLVVEFKRGWRVPPSRALDGVSLTVKPGETVGIVGESGSGKSTLGNAILGLVPVREGSIRFLGKDITDLPNNQRRLMSGQLQAIFQDPYNSLNPAMRIGQIVGETLRGGRRQIRNELSRDEVSRRVVAMLKRVGLPPDSVERYPADFSGGQRQRIGIARALLPSPRVVVCDEPVSSLDVSVQAQVINLLAELQADLKVSYLFISHDLAVVRHLATEVVVLYRGRVMEVGRSQQICSFPAHPYTRSLLAATPVLDPDLQRARRAARIANPIKNSDSIIGLQESGCPFASRCPHAIELCHETSPSLERSPVGTLAACHRLRELTIAQEIYVTDRPPGMAAFDAQIANFVPTQPTAAPELEFAKSNQPIEEQK
jgi:peptide/nickel transport system ATP-binding protein